MKLLVKINLKADIDLAMILSIASLMVSIVAII